MVKSITCLLFVLIDNSFMLQRICRKTFVQVRVVYYILKQTVGNKVYENIRSKSYKKNFTI